MDLSASTLPEIAAFLRRSKTAKKIPIPQLQNLPSELREAAEILRGLTGTWNPVELYTADPKSLHGEKQKFFATFLRGHVYQPVFSYEYAESFRLGDARAQLEDLLERARAYAPYDRGAELMKLLFVDKLKDDLATCNLVEGLQAKDEAKIGTALQDKYPGVDPRILQIAEEDLERHSTKPKRGTETPGELTEDQMRRMRELVLDAADVQAAFEWALDRYGMLRKGETGEGYTVVVDRRATAIDVRDKSVLGPSVFVPEGTRMTGERLLGLMAHEIEGHARQSWNGERLFLFGGGPLKIDEETLYEGLAMRYEYQFRKRYFGKEFDSHSLDYYVFAVRVGEEGGSFYDVFRDQMDRRLRLELGVPHHSAFSHEQAKDRNLYARVMEQAWGTAYRVMRGHTDMTNPCKFAMAKDLAYFRGHILDQQLCEHGQGFVNELTICSIGQLSILAEFDIDEKDVAVPFQDVTSDYLRMLLEKHGGGGSFQVKRML